MYDTEFDYSRYESLVREILERGVFTNSGPMAEELEFQLKQYLGCRNLVLTSSGTAALQVALRALELNGKIITSPFSYVATANSIAWLGLEPVFVDITDHDLGLDPNEVARAISPDIAGIMPVHAFGIPCDIDGIESAAASARLPTIYDAAACFGVRFRQQSVTNFGSIAVLSFHASKVFSTVEGGALIFSDEELYEKARAIVHHGCKRDRTPTYLGINAKLSELHAAFGLCTLEGIDARISMRRHVFDRLRARLAPDRRLRFPSGSPETVGNEAYCPILFESEEATLRTRRALHEVGVEARRYFYPSLHKLPHFQREQRLPIAEDIARRVLCVGFAKWSDEQIDHISETIIRRDVP